MLRVVVVDDSSSMRMVTKFWLEMDGTVEVVGEAGDGLAGFCLLETLQPDVAVVDLEMPGMRGVELIQLLRHQSYVGRLIAYSSDDRSLVHALRAGADAVVLKTGESAELLAAIRPTTAHAA